MTDTPITLTDYERRYRQHVLFLAHNSIFAHTHLDWYATEDWLERMSAPVEDGQPRAPVILAWQNRRLVGVIGVSPVLHGWCWLRLVACDDKSDPRAVITVLWGALRERLREQGVGYVSLLVITNWLLEHATVFGLQKSELVVTLQRRGHHLPEPRNGGGVVTIRPAEDEHLPIMTHIDNLAFSPPWQLSQPDLRQATRVASSVTVALIDDEIVGYQLTTRNRESAHLARLGVLPNLHGKGVGGALLNHMIDSLIQRGVRNITVNTQASNEKSQRLYKAYGFERNGYDMPVWTAHLT